jgi:hypothetical protein
MRRRNVCSQAMGAGQWTGQFRTRPHALLDVRGLESVEQWMGRLPRGARRTLSKALQLADDGSFTVASREIMGGQPAPHATLAHFRCIVAHEVRRQQAGATSAWQEGVA